MISVRGEDGGVEHEHAGGAQALARRAIVAHGREPTAGNECEARHRTEHHLHDRSDEIVLEGILHRQDDPEKEDEARPPRRKVSRP